jgi:hypothetical protein
MSKEFDKEVLDLLNSDEKAEALKEYRKYHGHINAFVCVDCGHESNTTGQTHKCTKCLGKLEIRVIKESTRPTSSEVVNGHVSPCQDCVFDPSEDATCDMCRDGDNFTPVVEPDDAFGLNQCPASSEVVRDAEVISFSKLVHMDTFQASNAFSTLQALIQSHKELEAERERDLYLEFGKGNILVLTTEDNKVILSRRNGTGVIGDKGPIEDGDDYTPGANDVVMKFTGSKSASVLAEAISDTAEILRKAGK